MAKYLLLKHYRGAPAAVNDVPMDHWAPDEITAHIEYMRDFALRLQETGEFVGEQALAPEGTFVRYDGEGKPPVTDGPFAETKECLAGFYMIEARDLNEAIQIASRIPPAQVGSIEVRPIRPIREAPNAHKAKKT